MINGNKTRKWHYETGISFEDNQANRAQNGFVWLELWQQCCNRCVDFFARGLFRARMNAMLKTCCCLRLIMKNEYPSVGECLVSKNAASQMSDTSIPPFGMYFERMRFHLWYYTVITTQKRGKGRKEKKINCSMSWISKLLWSRLHVWEDFVRLATTSRARVSRVASSAEMPAITGSSLSIKRKLAN